MQLLTYNSIKEIDSAVWQKAARDYPLLSRDYLLATEIPDQTLYVLGMERNGDCRGCAVLYLQMTDLMLFTPPDSFLGKTVNFIRDFIWPGFLKITVLECGPQSAIGPGVVGVYDLRFMRQFLGLLEDLRINAGASIAVIRDFKTASFIPDVEAAGFMAAPLLGEAELLIRWDTFEEYLGSLKSHYRRQVTSDIKKLELAKIEKETTTDFAHYAPDMLRLWRETSSRAKEYRREELDEAFFKGLSGHAVATTFWKGKDMVAFAVSILGPQSLHPIWMGADYAVNSECPLIFGIYYEMIDLAIRLNKTCLLFGDTTYGPKLRLGAELVPLKMYLKTHYPPVTWLLARLAAKLIPGQEVTKRDVFKKGG